MIDRRLGIGIRFLPSRRLRKSFTAVLQFANWPGDEIANSVVSQGRGAVGALRVGRIVVVRVGEESGMERWGGWFGASAIGILLLAGCQGWGGGWMNPVRVPPPGTGTYQLPPGYYNNVQPAQPPAGTGNSYQPPAGSTTRYEPSGAPGGFGGVQPAGYYGSSTTGAAGGQPSSAGLPGPTGFTATAAGGNSGGQVSSFNDNEVPSLQWQP